MNGSYNLKERNLKGALTAFRCEKSSCKKETMQVSMNTRDKASFTHKYQQGKFKARPWKNFWTTKVVHKTAQSPPLEFTKEKTDKHPSKNAKA